MKRPLEAPANLEPRAQPGRLRAIALAVVVHAAFFALIVFGVRWQSAPAPAFEAELWDKLPAAKPAPPPEPPPPPKEEPKPASKPEPPPKPPEPEAKPEPPKPDPAIAEKAEKLKREQEKRERLERAREEEARRKQEQEKKKREEEAAKKKQDELQAAKKKREEEARRREEERARAEAEKARIAAATAQQKAMQEWIDRIKAKILNRANVPDTVPTGAEVNVRIRILPGGDVLDISVTRNTSPTYAASIERAIRSASPLPVPPASSELFSRFRDLNLNFRHER